MTTARGFLCISCDFKGGAFIKAIAEHGHSVYLVTSEDKREEDWPWDALADVFYMPGSDGRLWNIEDLKQGTAHLMRQARIDRIIALDDYDVRKAAFLREEFRTPGMGQTTARHFYDKLAMRMQAHAAGIPVPGFTGLFNDAAIHQFFQESEGPWFIKPRSDAGALGIRKLTSEQQFWEHAETLGDNRHQFLVEEYKAGPVYHVDSLSFNGEIVFSRSSQYLAPPFDIAHGGGIFQSHTIPPGHPDDEALRATNARVLKAFGMMHGASHSEYIVSDGQVFFLETSARVGGAHLAEMVEAGTGVNLWSEWAKIEHALWSDADYTVPKPDHQHSGIIASLSRYEHPDYLQYKNPEIWWTMPKPYHVGFIFKADTRERIVDLLGKYAGIISRDYHASVPLKE